MISSYLCDIFFALCTCKNPCDNQHQNSEPLRWNKVRHAPWYEQNKNLKAFGKGILNSNSFGSCFKYIISFKIFWHFYSESGTCKAWKEEKQSQSTILDTLYIRNAYFNTITNNCQTAVKWITVYTCVQVERVYKSNPIFEAKNTTFLEKVWFFSFHQLNKINRWSGIQG